MRIKTSWLAAVALLTAMPLAAQTAAKENAVNAVEGPVTQSLNNQVNNNVVAGQVNADTQNAEAQAQYQADKEAYWAAISANDGKVARNDAHYMKMQEAYAAAMHDWRMQVIACKRGHQRACDLPTPVPANYM
jgi:hypothetical protein